MAAQGSHIGLAPEVGRYLWGQRRRSFICAKFVHLKLRAYHGKQPVRLAA